MENHRVLPSCSPTCLSQTISLLDVQRDAIALLREHEPELKKKTVWCVPFRIRYIQRIAWGISHYRDKVHEEFIRKKEKSMGGSLHGGKVRVEYP